MESIVPTGGYGIRTVRQPINGLVCGGSTLTANAQTWLSPEPMLGTSAENPVLLPAQGTARPTSGR